MIGEILPGLFQWTRFHPGIERLTYSSFDSSSGTLIDPMEPKEGVQRVGALETPRRIVLTNRHHYRHSDRYEKRFGCPVLCHEAGLGHFTARRPVAGFRFDEQLADGVRALELASICAEETTLLLDVADGVLCFGDGVTRERDGSLAFMPDDLLGDDPGAVKSGLARNLRRMFEEDFDALVFAHAEPVLGGAREMLSDFLSHQPPVQTRHIEPVVSRDGD
jgi:hypothetical protein